MWLRSWIPWRRNHIMMLPSSQSISQSVICGVVRLEMNVGIVCFCGVSWRQSEMEKSSSSPCPANEGKPISFPSGGTHHIMVPSPWPTSEVTLLVSVEDIFVLKFWCKDSEIRGFPMPLLLLNKHVLSRSAHCWDIHIHGGVWEDLSAHCKIFIVVSHQKNCPQILFL